MRVCVCVHKIYDKVQTRFHEEEIEKKIKKLNVCKPMMNQNSNDDHHHDPLIIRQTCYNKTNTHELFIEIKKRMNGTYPKEK